MRRAEGCEGGWGGLRGAEGDLVGMREAEGSCGKLRLAMGGIFAFIQVVRFFFWVN